MNELDCLLTSMAEANKEKYCCQHCGVLPELLYGRGLCRDCYRDPSIKEQYGGRQAVKKVNVPAPCLYCQRVKLLRSGLCSVCYRDPQARVIYPRQPLQVERPVLPKFGWYSLQPRCCHDMREGECPACEREQRAALATREEGEYDGGERGERG